MIDLPNLFPYEGYVENKDSVTVTNDEGIIQRTITNEDTTSKSKSCTLPKIDKNKGTSKTGEAS